MEGLIEGRIVHYVAYNNRHLAAIVIGVTPNKTEGEWEELPKDKIDIALFSNMANVNGNKNYGLQFHSDIPFDDEKKPGTWHWIERT
jgi:hypothetical protein